LEFRISEGLYVSSMSKLRMFVEAPDIIQEFIFGICGITAGASDCQDVARK
jgi:hypothetical protein